MVDNQDAGGTTEACHHMETIYIVEEKKPTA
jgi:hypothetical protein